MCCGKFIPRQYSPDHMEDLEMILHLRELPHHKGETINHVLCKAMYEKCIREHLLYVI